MDKFFEDTFRSISYPETKIEINQEDIEWLKQRTPNFSYKKAPGLDGLLDVMFQPPKQAGPFQTIFERDEREIKRQETNHYINLMKWIEDKRKQLEKNQNSIYAQGRQIYIVKKENNKSIEECRPISILPLTIKLIEDMIYQRIKEDVQQKIIKQINIRQTGFQGGKTTTINILKARQYLQRNPNQYVLYYDFKGVFNTPAHKIIFEQVLPRRGFDEKQIKWIGWIYQETSHTWDDKLQ